MEFKSQGTYNNEQFSSYVISFTTQHTDSNEVRLATPTDSKKQQFSGIAANIYSFQNMSLFKAHYKMYSSLYGEQRALNAKGDPVEAKDIIPNWDDAKAANKAIDDALVNKKGEINSATNIDQATKDNLIQEATDAADVAKNAIDQATTADAIKKAKDDGVSNINNVNVPDTSATKEAAKTAIDQAAQKKNEAIDNSKLTDEEKAGLHQQVSDEVNKAKAAIDDAQKAADVKTAQTQGETAINAVEIPTSASKTDAINTINTALAAKKAAINGTNLTAEEQSALVNKAQKLADAAIANINKATTNDAANTAKENGVQAINNMTIPTVSDAKQKALTNIDDVAKAAKQAIDNTNGITDSEKQAAKDQVDADAQAAKEAIAQADSNEAVTDAVNNGTVVINKDVANAAIDGALAEKNNSIDGAPNLTDEEKKAVKGQAKTAADSAKTDISNASTVAAVESDKSTGVDNINKVSIPAQSDAKQDAIKAINDAATAEKASINNSAILTNEEKQELIDHVNDSAETAKQAIESATDKSGVDTAKNDGLKKINDLEVPTHSKAKDAAIAEIYAELNKKLDAINNNLVLVTEEKDALTNEANTAADKAKDAINKAASNADVESEEDKGITNIQNVDNPAKSQVKEAAKAAVQAVADSKTNAIDNVPNLIAEEKAELVKQVNDIASNAKVNIDNSSSSQSVETVRDNGISAIKAVEIPTSSKTKNDANSDLDNTAAAAKKAIDETSGLTDDQKQTAKDQIDKAVDDAKENIKNASDNKGVADATDAGKLAIDKVSAKAAIDAAVAAKKSEIAQAPLTAEEAKPLNNLVDQDAAAAKAAIDAATTSAAVETAKNNGVETINNIKVPTTSATKDDANKATDAGNITPTVPGGKVTVKDPSHLTDDEKNQVKNNVDNANKDKFPEGTKVTVGDDGTATVNYPDGSKDTIPGDQLVQGQKGDTTDAGKITPTVPGDKVTVKDPSHLTDDEKNQVKNNVDNANKDKFPEGTKVTVGDDGTATVNYPDGSKDTIPGDQLVQGQKGDTTDAGKITPTVPGGKVTVKDPSHLTDDEKKQVENNVDNANKDKFPAGTTVEVGDDGTATVNYPDGSKDTIPGDQLVQGQKGSTTDAGNITPTIPGGKVTVKDPSHLTDDEKKQVKNNVDNANKDKFPAGTDVTVGDDGTATVNYPDGSKDTIPGDQLVQGQKGDTTDAGNITPTVPGDKVTVKDPSHLTDDEKKQVKNNVDNANKDKFPAGTDVTVGDDGTATVNYPDGSKDVIAGTDLIIAAKGEDVLGSKYHSHKNGSNSSQADRVKGASTANGSIANAGNNLGVKAESDNAFVGVKGESDNAIGNNKATSLKTLPQTGTKDTSILGVLGMLLASLGLFGFKKKRDKE